MHDYLAQSTGLACLHSVTQDQAKLLLNIFNGDMVRAKQICELLDRNRDLDFFTVCLVLSIGMNKGEAKKC